MAHFDVTGLAAGEEGGREAFTEGNTRGVSHASYSHPGFPSHCRITSSLLLLCARLDFLCWGKARLERFYTKTLFKVLTK